MNVKLIISFLKDLEKNNNREWFNLNKNRYLEAKSEFEAFTEKVLAEVSGIDPEIGKLSIKDCVFRIYNDTRFYKDKPPYKTNMGAFMAKGGKNAGNAGFYFHMEPGQCFLGGGIYMPPADRLKLIRQEIYFHPEKFQSIIENKNFKKYFGHIEGEMSSRVPKDFPKDFKGAEWLKYKSYAVIHNIEINSLSEPDILKYMNKVYASMQPLNEFLNNALTMK